MSLSEEKTMILKMLEEGKITADEAIKLMEAIEIGNKQNSGEASSKQGKQPNFQYEVSKVKDRVKDWKKDIKKSYNQKDFERTLDDVISKTEKLGKTVANTTFGIVDKVVDFVDSFVETNTFNMFGSFKAVDRIFEASALEGIELDVEGFNGQILVKKHLEDKILIKTRVRSPLDDADSMLVFSQDNNNISLKLNRSSNNVSVSHEIFLPAIKLKKIALSSSNGRIYVENSNSENLETLTRNSHIELMGVNSDNILVDTKNARILISYISGKNIKINTNNSLIDVKHIKAQSLSAITVDGRILVENVRNLEDCHELNMELRTTNGSIKINMNDMDDRAYKVKAHNANGSINLLIPEMVYHNVNRQGIGTNVIEAESKEFESHSKKVNIDVQTVNGYIEVVK